MKVAFFLIKYFPYGGLSRDFLKIANYFISKGVEVDVYVNEWCGDVVSDINIVQLKDSSLTNHGKIVNYCKWMQEILKNKIYDATISFNKLPNVDFYYVADACYLDKVDKEKKGLLKWLYKSSERYRIFSLMEKKVFYSRSKTRLLFIDKSQIGRYGKYYSFDESRVHILPPSLSKECIFFKEEHMHTENKYNLVQVGSDFKRKGLKRSLIAIASLSDKLKEKVCFNIIGEGNKGDFDSLIKSLKLEKNVFFLGAKETAYKDIYESDVLLHPAYSENTGTVILEALYLGTPVIATAECGYSHFIREYKAGIVIDEPFDQNDFNNSLRKLLESKEILSNFSMNSLKIRKDFNFRIMESTVYELIERWVQENGKKD